MSEDSRAAIGRVRCAVKTSTLMHARELLLPHISPTFPRVPKAPTEIVLITLRFKDLEQRRGAVNTHPHGQR